MQAYRTEVTLTENGTLKLDALPFHAGERVEVIVLAAIKTKPDDERYPLRGLMPYRYDRPTDPVGEEDWEALQ